MPRIADASARAFLGANSKYACGEKPHHEFNASFFCIELICFFSVIAWGYIRLFGIRGFVIHDSDKRITICLSAFY